MRSLRLLRCLLSLGLLLLLCRLLYLALLQGFLRLCLFVYHSCFFFLVYTLFLLVFSRTDFVAFEELLHCVRLFPFRQVLDRLLVHLVVVEGHAEQAEMGRFLELAPEILDEVFEYARVLVEFQE